MNITWLDHLNIQDHLCKSTDCRRAVVAYDIAATELETSSSSSASPLPLHPAYSSSALRLASKKLMYSTHSTP